MKEKPFSKYQILANVVMIIWTLAIILPFILLFMSSITDENTLVANGYSFFPKKFSLASYSYIIKSGGQILKAYGVSIGVTVVGTLLNVLLSALMAYPLSVKNLPGRNVMMFFVFFTMLFNGGIVPSYIMWTKIFHIKDTIFALLIPNYLVTAFNVILVKNYYANNIPDSLVEAAEIDGATEMTIFRKIMLPLAVPTVATISLFTGLCYWNDWTNGLYYVSNEKLYSIQMLLMKIMNNIQALRSNSNAALLGTGSVDLPGTAIRMAMAVIGILPILLIYPFVQKYLVRGVVVGAVKG